MRHHDRDAQAHLITCELEADEVAEADALAASEGHRAVAGNVCAIKAEQHISLLQCLAGRGGWLHPPYQHSLLTFLQQEYRVSKEESTLNPQSPD